MSQKYGKALTWSTVGAPHPFDGIAEDYSYKDAFDENQVEGEEEIAAVILTGRKGEISFNATATSASTNFLSLQNGVKLAITGVVGGIILVTQVVETWAIKQPKRLSMSATHFPDMVDADGAAAEELNAFTPAQEGLIIRPAGGINFSTAGMSHTSGIIQGLTLTQKIKLSTEEDELGKIVAAFVSNYVRTLDLDLISTGDKPEPGTILTVTGAPAHASGYVINASELAYRKGDKKTYKVNATWAPCMGVAA